MTNKVPQPQPHHTRQPVESQQLLVPYMEGKELIADMLDMLPGSWCQVLGVRYLGAIAEEIK